MTDREKFRSTFYHLHASADTITEVMNMTELAKTNRVRRFTRPLILVAAALALLMALSVTAYAADVGGIRRNIQLWIRGDQTDTVLDVTQEGDITTYSISYTDENGNEQSRGGGGVAIEAFGRERPLTEEEILDLLRNSAEVSYQDDGSVWVYYHSQKVEITDKFDEDGVCYVHLIDGDDNLYMTVKYNDGFAASPHSYPSPKSFN